MPPEGGEPNEVPVIEIYFFPFFCKDNDKRRWT